MNTLSTWLGHQNSQTTELYMHYFPASGEKDLINDIIGDSVRTQSVPSRHTQDDTDAHIQTHRGTAYAPIQV